METDIGKIEKMKYKELQKLAKEVEVDKGIEINRGAGTKPLREAIITALRGEAVVRTTATEDAIIYQVCLDQNPTGGILLNLVKDSRTVYLAYEGSDLEEVKKIQDQYRDTPTRVFVYKKK